MGQREGFSTSDIEKINRMYSCQGSNGQQPITPVTSNIPRPTVSGISPIAITPTRPSPIAGTGPVLFPVNPPSSGNNFQGQRPSGSGSYPGYGGNYYPNNGPSGYGGNYYPSGPYYPYFEGKEEQEIKEVSENVIEE